MVHQPGRHHRHPHPADGHPDPGLRSRHRERGAVGSARCLGRPSRRLGGPVHPGLHRARVRHPRVHHRRVSRPVLRAGHALVQADRLRSAHHVLLRLGLDGDAPGDRPVDRPGGRCRPAGAQLRHRRAAPGLGPDPAQPRRLRAERPVQARPAERRRPGPVRPGPVIRRPPRRRRDHRGGFRHPRPRPGCGPGDIRRRRAPGHGPGRGHRGDRHPGQPGYRSPARIPEPEGANIMTEAAVSTGVLAPDVTSDMRAARSHLARRFLKNPLGIAALSVLVLIVLAAICAPLLTSYNPNSVSVLSILQGPGAGHLLGTDGAGRDVWARLLYGARFTLAGALLATVVAAVLGITSGLAAGYYGKWFESSASWITTLLMALPGIVVLLAARAVLGPSLWTVMIIFGVLLIPAFYRLVYAAVSGVRNELYVDAARVSGGSDSRIIARHILTVVRAPIILQGSIVFGIAIAVQVGLDFLGFGDQAIPTWGNMLNDGFTNLYRDPQLVVWPALAVVITGVPLTLFANALRDELEQSPRPRRRRRRRATMATPAEAPAAGVTAAAVTAV